MSYVGVHSVVCIVRYEMAYCHTIPYHPIGYNNVPDNAIPFNTPEHNTIPCAFIHNTIQYYAIQWHTIEGNRQQYNATSYSTRSHHPIPHVSHYTGATRNSRLLQAMVLGGIFKNPILKTVKDYCRYQTFH